MVRLGFLLTSLVAAVLLMACGNPQSRVPSPHASSAPPAAVTPPPRAVPSSLAPTATSAANGQAAAAAQCAAGQLALTLDTQPGAGGHWALVLLVRNTGGAPCEISGYPGVDGVLASGAAIHAQRTLSGYMGGLWAGRTPTLTLGSGQVAGAMVEGLNDSQTGAPCAQFTAFLVTPPNTTTTSRLVPSTGHVNYCRQSLQVHPVVGGTLGQQR